MAIDEELQKQANQATIDFSLKTLGSLFLLNGAAATALLAKTDVPVVAASVFAVAALWAVAAMGIAHIFCLVTVETFRSPAPKNSDEPWLDLFLPDSYKRLLLLWGMPGQKLSFSQFLTWRVRLTIFSLGPAVLFLAGLIVSGVTLC